jgi:OmpA-OmpF porin, OOP family
MRKILIGILIFCSGFVYSNTETILPELSELKNWQLRGMIRSALRINDHYQARDLMLESYRRNPGNAKLKTNLGKVLFRTRDYELAAELLWDTYNDNPGNNLEALFYYARIQKIFGNYEEALEHFDLLRRRHRRIGGEGINRSRIDVEMEGCLMGIAAKDTMVTKEIIQLNTSVNSPFIEYGPILLNDNEFMYGSLIHNELPVVELGSVFSPVRQFFKASRINDEWKGGLEPEAPFFNFPEFDSGRGAFSVDFQRFYSVGCYVNHRGKTVCHIYVSKLENGIWSDPEKLCREVNHPRFTSTQPAVGTCFDPSLEVLYFSSDRPGGAGGMDIWFSVYDKQNGTYQKAQNAGVFINTRQDEVTPYFDLTSHRLYFSSDGWPSYGGLDVFYATGNMVTWEMPVNVGVPVNSSWDDLDFTQNRSGKFGVFASNRPGSMSHEHHPCCDDIFVFNDTESPRVLVTGRLVREDRFDEKERVISHVTDSVEIPLLQQPEDILRNLRVSIRMVKDSTETVYLQDITTNEEGLFEVWVDPGMDYQLRVADTTLLDRNIPLSTRDLSGDREVDMSTIALNTIPQRAIVIENIYYEFDRTELTSDAKAALDTTLLVLLNKYSFIKVEIAAHTDDIGEENYNRQLSERRAESVVKYLVSKGVSRQRLTAKGYGLSNPIAPNRHPDGSDNPEGRQRNRRTEFKIVGSMQP